MRARVVILGIRPATDEVVPRTNATEPFAGSLQFAGETFAYSSTSAARVSAGHNQAQGVSEKRLFVLLRWNGGIRHAAASNVGTSCGNE